MTQKILVVDDEREIVKLVRAYLEQAGFRVVTAFDGQEGLTVFRHEKPDLVVLDLNLPRIDGLDVCRTIRRESDTPVIMLTARVEEQDRLIGLELGADDYVVKPFSPREVVARVRAVLRRAGAAEEGAEVVRAGALTLDRARYRAELRSAEGAEREITLTPTEFEILAALASQPGRVFSRAQLLTVARGVAFESYERAIDSHIRNLRRKLEPDDCIVTVHGVGYKFVES